MDGMKKTKWMDGMKKTKWMAAVLVFAAANSWAQETAPASPWKFNLNFRTRWEDSNQADATLTDRKQFSHIRIRPMVTFEGFQQMKVVMEGQYAKILGAQNLQPSTAAANASVDTSGNTSYSGGADTLTFRQAYLDMALNENTSLIIGRQALQYGDQMIIAPSDWGVFGRAFDAARLKYTWDKNSAELFHSKIVENTSTTSAKGDDKNLAGLYITLVPHENVKAWDLYGFYQSDDQATTSNGSGASATDATRPWYFGTYGTRVATDFGSWGLKAEYAQNFGTENSAAMGENKENSAIDSTLWYKMGETVKHQFGLQYFQAGKNWRELYPTTNSALGRVDVVGRRNLSGVGLHWNAVWSDLWSTDVDGYLFQRTSTDATAFSTNSTTAVGGLASDSKDVGSEVDLIAKYAWQKNVNIVLGACFFQEGSYLKDSITDTRTPHYGFALIEGKY
jgi:hypothetical protein